MSGSDEVCSARTANLREAEPNTWPAGSIRALLLFLNYRPICLPLYFPRLLKHFFAAQKLVGQVMILATTSTHKQKVSGLQVSKQTGSRWVGVMGALVPFKLNDLMTSYISHHQPPHSTCYHDGDRRQSRFTVSGQDP